MQKPDVHGLFDPATATWSYVIWAEGHKDKRCAIIDCVLDYDIHAGRTSTTSADKIIHFIQDKGLEVEWILETHIHADHLTAAQYIKNKCGGKTAISTHILKVIETWQPIFNTPHDTPLNGYQFDHLFNDEEAFTIGSLEAKIIHTPGHTPSDTSYIIGDAVFVGDCMLLPDVGTGRCDFPGGSASDAYTSIQKLLSLPNNTRMYIGHDYPPENGRLPACETTVSAQKENIRLQGNVEKNAFITQRDKDDKGKAVPDLLIPSIQINLRGGSFGEAINGVQYIKVPINTV